MNKRNLMDISELGGYKFTGDSGIEYKIEIEQFYISNILHRITVYIYNNEIKVRAHVCDIDNNGRYERLAPSVAEIYEKCIETYNSKLKDIEQDSKEKEEIFIKYFDRAWRSYLFMLYLIYRKGDEVNEIL